MSTLFLLYESASGFGVFEVLNADELAQQTDAVQQSITDFNRFGRLIKLTAFKPFNSAADALEQINAVSECILTDDLRNFLEQAMPKGKAEGKKKPKFQLGVQEPKLASAIQDETGIPCVSNTDTVGELLRGVRLHATRFLKGLEESDLQKAQLGLAHAYSRAKVKFNVNRVDNMIIQAIALLDTLDKDINTFVMRVREWYSWHFPELVRLVNDNYQYAKLALLIKDKGTLTEDKVPAIAEVVGDQDKASDVFEAAKTSMGQDISPIDLVNIETFARRVISLAEYRHKLHTYLLDKMHVVAPNLSALIGEVVGARLISHAGSLTNLAKYPASTVQILGAEKALFRALKTKGNTPKYGLIFHSSFIGRAKQRNKGRISRYLANKCSIASRIDCFSELATDAFGAKMKEQVEERLRFYEDGIAPKKNITAMQEAIQSLAGATDMDLDDAEEPKPKKKKKKDKDTEGAEATDAAAPAEQGDADQPKTDKKKKKKKRTAAEEALEAAVTTAEQPTKKKKKKAKDTKA